MTLEDAPGPAVRSADIFTAADRFPAGIGMADRRREA